MNDHYYCTGTNFEVINCPAFNEDTRECIEKNSKSIRCKDNDCMIKSHIVALSALVGVASRTPYSSECIGAKACFNSFRIEKEKRNENSVD